MVPSAVVSALKVVPSKSPTKYWAALPPNGPPGLMLHTSTHFFSSVPATLSWNMSGHSHTPSCAPMPLPKRLASFQFFRSGEVKMSISFSKAWASSMTHCPVRSSQNILGSRASVSSVTMGLPGYLVKVLPPSVL